MARPPNPETSRANGGKNPRTGVVGKPFQKGHKGGPGRPPGSRDKVDLLKQDLTEQAITEGKMPLEFFLEVMRNEKRGLAIRMDAAKAAAPYVHKRQPIAVEHKDERFKVFDISDLEGLTDEELEVMHGIMVKAAEAEARRAQNPFLADPRVTQVPSTPLASSARQLPALEHDGPAVHVDTATVRPPWEL